MLSGQNEKCEKYLGSFKPVTRQWGEHVTADYIVSGRRKDDSTGMRSCTGDRHALVMMDVHTRMRAFYPVPYKGTDYTYRSFLHFAGVYEDNDHNIARLYLDGGDEMRAAVKRLNTLVRPASLVSTRQMPWPNATTRTSCMAYGLYLYRQECLRHVGRMPECDIVVTGTSCSIRRACRRGQRRMDRNSLA